MFLRIAGAAALASLGLAPVAVAATAGPGTLSVTGQGWVIVVPDTASVSVSVTRTAPNPALALSAMNASADRIVAGARRLGVATGQIQTEYVDSSCRRVKISSSGHARRVRRCGATESLQITATTARIGAVIDAATHAGASTISGPDFSFSNPAAGEIAAEHAAIVDARTQADATAAQLGYTVTGVQSVALNPRSSDVGVSGSAAPPLASAPTPTTVRPGSQVVSATVAVTYTIAPTT